MSEPRDPAELFVVLHNSGRVASAWSEKESADDNASGWNAHVTSYVPKSDLDAALARIAELEAKEQTDDVPGDSEP